MSSSPRYAHHKLASFFIVLALALSLVIPVHAQESAVAEEETASVQDEALVGATQDETTDFETAHNTGCLPDFVIDNPTNGSTVTGIGLIYGRGYDAGNTGLGSGMDVYDLYRGDTFIMTTAAGASRDPGHVRADFDTAVGKSDLRGGFIFRIDWSTQPGGNQTYRVLGRTGCEWVERTFSVNVNPAPPAPAASLSISDETRSASTSSTTTGTVCQTYSQVYPYNCIGYGTNTIGNVYGNTSVCSQYSTVYPYNCISYGGTIGGYGSTYSDMNFDFTVTLSPATTQTVTVNYATADGSAVSGNDYASTSGSLSFAPGETSKTITVRVYSRGGDTTDRDFYVRLTNPINAGLSDGEGRGRIQRRYGGYGGYGGCVTDVYGNCTGTNIGNCAAYGIGYTWNGYQCVPGTGGGIGGTFSVINVNGNTCAENTTCTFRITQLGGSGYVTVNWSASGATPGSSCSTSGVDYSPASGAVSVPANSTADVQLTICLDATDAALETFTFTITPTSGTASVPSVTVTIPA